ncbi:MAG: DNA mismatch repair endonuclease MutL, partial [Vicinamibacteria bacterium]
MPPRVRLLPPDVADRIAAGEVIERPASAVKELVENALDAEATDVSVVIEDGGRSLIRVVDNGHGMAPEDARLAFERHATSKIATEKDLEEISTLGFRGEALPSLAAVSRITLATKPLGNLEGCRIRFEGGKLVFEEPAAAAKGTEVTVESIFFNTPARRKFLKSARVEAARVAETLTELALACPRCRLTLEHGGREVVAFAPSAKARDRAESVLGREMKGGAITLEERFGALRLSGLLIDPARTATSTRRIYTIVNGRAVRDRGLLHAVMEGYREVLMRGRYPMAVIYVDLPPEAVDVNVHPAKREVRFSDAGAVHESVRSAVSRALARKERRTSAAGQSLSLRAPAAGCARGNPILPATLGEGLFDSDFMRGHPSAAAESEGRYGHHSELEPLGQAGGTY